ADTGISRNGCTEGTREALLQELMLWSQNPLTERIYWLNGMAGTGKTTIAYSFCDTLGQQNFLGASFFCSRAVEETRHVHRIIPTIVHTLAENRHLPARFASSIINALTRDDSLANTAMLEKQCQALLVDPLNISMRDSGFFPIIIIDALDECSDAEQVHRLLRTLFQRAPSLPVKFFVTSRPETEHQKYQDAHLYHSFILHNIEGDLVKADITKYLNDKFNSLRSLRDMGISDSDVKALAEQADNLFIFASTAFKFISDPLINDPEGRLQLLLRSDWETSALDSLYSQVMGQLFTCLRPSQHESMECIIRIIIAASEPLTSQCIACLLKGDMNANGNAVKRLMEPLKSVLFVTSEDNPQISPFHASFPDFLTHKSRSKQYYLEPGQSHHILTQQCLTLINTTFTTTKYESMHHPTSVSLLSQALTYSCSFWAFHLSLCSDVDDKVQGLLSYFLQTQVLHWLEYLQYTGQLHVAVEALASSQKPILQRYPTLLSLVVDAQRFLLENFDIINKNPSELYKSGLLWLPKSSLMRQHYICKQSPQSHWPQVIKGLRFTWDAIWHTFVGHSDRVCCIAYSPDGGHVASGSQDMTVRIWDVATGQQEQLLEGHSHSVECVAYSPDGGHVASGSQDNTVRIWDIATGQQEQLVEGHSHWVECVTYSPDGRHFVSGSRDKTVRIWDAATGQQEQLLQGHSYAVESVAYCPDGRYIVSGSRDNTVRIWDATTGQQKRLLVGHSHWVESVAYSPYGRHIVSGSWDNTVRVWDAATGQQEQLLEGHSYAVKSVVYSPDGRHIASGSRDNTVRIWDAATGQQEQILEGPSHWVESVAYSPDGKHVASGSQDKTIRIWDTCNQAGLLEHLLEGHSHWVESVAYSPDGRHIASGSWDNTVRVWDAATGQQEQLLQGHSYAVESVAYSPDGRHIVSGSQDKTVRIWDVATGQQEQLLEGHSYGVESVAYSPDGRHVASGSRDNTVRIWDVVNGEQEQVLTGQSEAANPNIFMSVGHSVTHHPSIATAYSIQHENGQEWLIDPFHDCKWCISPCYSAAEIMGFHGSHICLRYGSKNLIFLQMPSCPA
ncbi:WD40 repeat-like protein, partial [Sistotremastrum niveocremeum HHB9708]